jgi:hypothetical protein
MAVLMAALWVVLMAALSVYLQVAQLVGTMAALSAVKSEIWLEIPKVGLLVEKKAVTRAAHLAGYLVMRKVAVSADRLAERLAEHLVVASVAQLDAS